MRGRSPPSASPAMRSAPARAGGVSWPACAAPPRLAGTERRLRDARGRRAAGSSCRRNRRSSPKRRRRSWAANSSSTSRRISSKRTARHGAAGPVEGAKNFDVIRQMLAGMSPKECRTGKAHLQCYDAENYVKEIFLDSDTDLAVLPSCPRCPTRHSAVDRGGGGDPGGGREAGARRAPARCTASSPPTSASRASSTRWPSSPRRKSARASSTPCGARRAGWWLDDPKLGIPFIENARSLGIKRHRIHKGIPLPGDGPDLHPSCRDVGLVAKMFPGRDLYHLSLGLSPSTPERGRTIRPTPTRGVDALMQSLADNGIAPNSNVYAELGAPGAPDEQTRPGGARPRQALEARRRGPRAVGDRLHLVRLAQDQIQAFRAFEISASTRRSTATRRSRPLKAKILGMNGAALRRRSRQGAPALAASIPWAA